MNNDNVSTNFASNFQAGLNAASNFTNSSQTSVSFMDDLVKEYLLFRGFTGCLKSFEADLKLDKDKCLKADKVVEQLFQFVYSFDLSGLLDYWSYLDMKYFSRLTLKLSGSSSISLTRKYELFLLRYYVVFAIQSNKIDKCFEFFETYAAKLHSQVEWKEWFCLPFLKNPEENSTFSVYFSKNWTESFYISLQNFLNIVFQSLQYPRLLNYEEDSFWNKQSGQFKNNASMNAEQDSLLTDEFHLLESNTQNKPASSLISIFKNFTNPKSKSSPIEPKSSSHLRTNFKGYSSTASKETAKKLSLNLNDTPTKKNDEIFTNQDTSDIFMAEASKENYPKINESKSTEENFTKPIITEVDSLIRSEKSIDTLPFLVLSQEDYSDHKNSIITCKASRDGKYQNQNHLPENLYNCTGMAKRVLRHFLIISKPCHKSYFVKPSSN